MATNYSDGGLVRGSKIIAITNINYLNKTLKLNPGTRSAYEYDQNGLPKASSHVDDFEKFSGEIMTYTNVVAPPKFTLFLADLGNGNTNYIILERDFNYTTEGLQSYTVSGVKLYN